MKAYIYIALNEDRLDKVKFGFTENPTRRIMDSLEQHSYKSKYINIFPIEFDTKYYNEADMFISHLG